VAWLLSASGQTLLDHAGWGENFLWLWTYDVSSGAERRLQNFPDGFSLHPSRDRQNVLLVASDAQRYRAECTIRPADDPLAVLATATFTGRGWTFDGDASLWENVPRYVRAGVGGQTYLLHIDPDADEPDPLDWYVHGGYDLVYQGLVDVSAVPGSHVLIMSIQRDSHPVLYDPDQRRVVGKIALAERHGNPRPWFSTGGDQLWIADYDTLLRLDSTWTTRSAAQLQPPKGTMGQFIGNFWLTPDETRCIVPRPFSDDVLILDATTLAARDAIKTTSQPLDAALVRGQLITRDWQSRAVHVTPA
jgi:hypothetical protein